MESNIHRDHDSSISCLECGFHFAFFFKDESKVTGPNCPMLLQCGHTICYRCVQKSLKGTNGVNCPACGTFSCINNKLKIQKELPLSTYIIGKLFVRKSERPRDKIIGFYNTPTKMDQVTDSGTCGECNAVPPEWSCHQCCVDFCNQCFEKLHRVGVVLRRHKKVKIQVSSIECEEAMCQEHPGNVCEFYCEDCSQYICDACLRKEHLKHACVSVIEKNKEIFKEYSEAYKQVESVYEQLCATQKELQITETQDKEASEKEKEVVKHFGRLHGILQLQEQNVLKQLSNFKELNKTSLSQTSNIVERDLKRLQKLLLNWSESSLAEDPNFPLFGVLEQLKKASLLPCHIKDTGAQETVKFELTIDQDIIKQLHNHCKLEVPPIRTYTLCPVIHLPQNCLSKLDNDVTPQLPDMKINDKTVDTIPKKTSYQEVLRKNRLSLQLNKIQQTTGIVACISSLLPVTTGSTEVVMLSHLASPGCFYVQRKQVMPHLDELTEMLSNQVATLASPPNTIDTETMYLCRFKNKWYRGVVKLDWGENKYEVFYSDYGNTEIVKSNQLREIPKHYTKIPPQAMLCSLLDCVPVLQPWSAEVIKLMAKMTDGVEFLMYIESIEAGLHNVHLRSLDDSILSVAEVLMYLGHAQVLEKSLLEGEHFKNLFSKSKRNVKSYFSDISVKERETFDGQITHINTPSNFYIQKLSQGGKHLIKLMQELTRVCNSMKAGEETVYSPVPGLPVAAKFSDGLWYRGVVLQIVGTGQVHIQYVDYGNIECVSWEDIRVLRPEFLRMNIQAIKCALSDVLPNRPKGWSACAGKAFENMAKKNTLFRIFVDKVEATHIKVVLYDVQACKDVCFNGLMVHEGHAKCAGSNATRAEYLRETEDLTQSDYTPSSSSVTSQPDKRLPSNLPKSENVHSVSNNNSVKSNHMNGIDVYLMHEGLEDEASRMKVKVLKVVNPGELYVTFTEVSKKVSNLTVEMTEYYKATQEEDRCWEEGDLCAVLQLNDNKWYRGLINSATSNRFKVFIKDIVDVLEVDKSGMRSLEPQFTSVMDGSIKCHLSGIIPPGGSKTWPQIAVEHAKIFLNESTAEYFITQMGDLVKDSLPLQFWKKTIVNSGALDPMEEVWKDLSFELIRLGYVLPDVKSDHYKMMKKHESFNYQNTHNVGVTEWLQESFQTIVSEKSASTSNSVFGQYNDITDWKPAKPFKKMDFIANATYVDYDCGIYLQELEADATLELIRSGLTSVFSGSVPQPQDLEWSKGQICTAYYKVDNFWYRGKVKEVTPEHIEVYFVDYGNIEHVQPEFLRKNIVLGQIPIQCHRCIIEGLIPVSLDGKWPVKALDFIHGTIVTKKCRVNLKPYKSNTNPYSIISLTVPSGHNMMELLLSMNHATYVIDCNKVDETDPTDILPDIGPLDTMSEQSDLAPIVPETLETQVYNWSDFSEIYKEGSSETMSTYKVFTIPDSLTEISVEVTALAGFNCFYVIITECDDPEIVDYLKEIEQLSKCMQEEAGNMLYISEPVIGMCCVGCFTEDDAWYRAIITDVDKERRVCTVKYVDYGNTEEIPVGRLRSLKAEWLKTPTQCLQVNLHNVIKGPDYDDDSLKNLLIGCFKKPPYTMVIEARQPRLEVELYNSEGEIAYESVICDGLLARIENH